MTKEVKVEGWRFIMRPRARVVQSQLRYGPYWQISASRSLIGCVSISSAGRNDQKSTRPFHPPKRPPELSFLSILSGGPLAELSSFFPHSLPHFHATRSLLVTL